MAMKEFCLALLVAVAVIHAAAGEKKKVVCYLGSWANYRQGEGKFLIEDIDPFLCTHLVYGFAKLSGNKIAAYDPYLDLKENWGLGAFQRFNGLKKKNPELKTIIAIGGWNEGSTKYSAMAANAASRAEFVQSVVDFCDKYEFDGLDMDWEYPANRGGAPSDKQTFVQLLKELSEAFKPKGYLLTAAVSAGKATMDTAYDVPGVGKYLDIINVMAYDFHGSWEKVTGHNAPLYARPEESEAHKVLNVDYAINYWINNGAPKEKIVLGMGLYGRSFTLNDANNHGIDAPTNAPGAGGPVTKEPGMLGYNEICKFVKSGWTEVFVDKIEAPYAYKDRQWVGYDNKKSIAIKTEYALKMGLGGGMVWSLETDDFRGLCHGEKYPLLTTIYEILNGKVERQTPDPNRPTETEGPTTTTKPRPSPSTNFECPGAGYFRDPEVCSIFYQCVDDGTGKINKHEFDCGDGNAFNEVAKVCDHKENVKGCS